MAEMGEEAVVLALEELEVLRLADLEGLEQSECARELGVSQSTVQRMLQTARHRVAEALVLGKSLRIEAGRAAVARLRQQLALIEPQVEYLQAWLEEVEERGIRDA